jgi:hypothetical protein
MATPLQAGLVVESPLASRSGERRAKLEAAPPLSCGKPVNAYASTTTSVRVKLDNLAKSKDERAY